MKDPGDEVESYAVADPGEGPGVPLIYRPNKLRDEGPKKNSLDPPTPPPVISRSGSATAVQSRRTIFVHFFAVRSQRRSQLKEGSKLVTWRNRDED